MIRYIIIRLFLWCLLIGIIVAGLFLSFGPGIIETVFSAEYEVIVIRPKDNDVRVFYTSDATGLKSTKDITYQIKKVK
jgi:hypothetical protein